MLSRSAVASKSAPAPARRRTSRSVKMPTGTVPSQTTTEPTFFSSMRRIASAAVSSGSAVTSRTRITPPICMAASLPSVVIGDNPHDTGPHSLGRGNFGRGYI